MADAPWLRRAKTLPAGQSARMKCCSDDRSMIVSNGKRGYTGYCFRCQEPLFEPHGLFTLEQLAQRKRELELLQSKEVRLPDDFTYDIPVSEAVWLYKSGIDAVLAKDYGIGYSPSLRRVVLPVYKGDDLEGFTARSTTSKPKYIEKAKHGDVIFVARPEFMLPSAVAEPLQVDLVLVEDNLSAIRVGRVARNVVSLMGTSCSTNQMAQCFDRCGLQMAGMARVAVWLDPDGPGRKASREICRSLQLVGHSLREIHSTRDPKYLSYREIKEHLSD